MWRVACAARRDVIKSYVSFMFSNFTVSELAMRMLEAASL